MIRTSLAWAFENSDVIKEWVISASTEKVIVVMFMGDLGMILDLAVEKGKENRRERKTMDIGKMSFGEAIEMAKKGFKISRQGWNGKGQYVELASCISYKRPDGEVVNPEHEAIGNAALAFCGTSGTQLGWLASQADMLAEDWRVIE